MYIASKTLSFTNYRPERKKCILFYTISTNNITFKYTFYTQNDDQVFLTYSEVRTPS